MKYLLILALLISPLAYAHHDDEDAPPPIQNGDNSSSSSNTTKHLLEAAVLTGIVVCVIRKCWQTEDETTQIHFETKQKSPNESNN